MSDVVLHAQDIHKSFGKGEHRLDVLRGIDLSICRGEIIAVTGPSGVGKSTLLHILGALDRPTRGRLLLDSTEVFSLSDDQLARFRNETVGFIFQFHHLLPEFSALENVMMPMLIGGRLPKGAEQSARDLLERVGLADRQHHRPGELSGGEQQRVAVARALANDPLVILADEPSGNLDIANSEMLHEMLWELARSLSQTFVIVTHDLQLAQKADRRIDLMAGKAIAVD